MGTIVVLVILIVIVGLAIRGMVKARKNGKSLSCGGDCSHCGGHQEHCGKSEGEL